MKTITRFAVPVLLVIPFLLLLSDCSRYRSDPAACQSQADCNPDKLCGDFMQCVDGLCDPGTVVSYPCDEECQSDADCQAGMHCQFGQKAMCVPDGTCAEVEECLGLAHDACLGSWSCTDLVCVYACQDLGSCSDNDDCVLADKDCCCGSGQDDYVAINQEKLSDWLSREECRGVGCPEMACLVPETIAAACVDGQCAVELTKPTDMKTCVQDSDCAVVAVGCCACLDGTSSITSVRVDRLDDWGGREECSNVLCEQCLYPTDPTVGSCWDDACARPVCRRDGPSGQCEAELADPFACAQDQDCTRSDLACPTCGCADGYSEGAINTDWTALYQAWTEYTCMFMGACAPGPFGVNACTNRPGVCEAGRCDVLGQTCEDCQDIWAPVCATAPNDAMYTFPNDCQADCAWGDAFVVYPGRCECMVDCDCMDPYMCQACAANGETYGCSYGEITCNGLEPLYPGDCDPDCDYCAFLNRMPIQACGQDFFTYAEMCYAECLGRDYWHLGACEANEGHACGASGNQPCPSDELFCLIVDNAPGAGGRCIKLGACIVPEHCDGQPLAVDPCIGHWTCPDHECAYICD
jgi:hypothetical protein